jgi:hypothetical protein
MNKICETNVCLLFVIIFNHTEDNLEFNKKIINFSPEYEYSPKSLALMIPLFSVFSKPVPEDVHWPTYSKDQQQYYIFNAEKSGTGKGPRAQSCAFWNDFLPKLKEHPGNNNYTLFIPVLK